MTRYHRPGAYYERTDRARPEAVPIRTDVAGLVGIARRGPVDVPVPVETFRQFQSHFGDFTGAGYLAYAVKAFFENGGARVWVVRVASRREDRGLRAATLEVGTPGQGWRIAASSGGSWGNALSVRLRRERRAATLLKVADCTDRVLVPDSVAGLARYDLVEIAQPGLPVQTAVIAEIDAVTGAVRLEGDRDRFAYPFQRISLDPDLGATLTSVSYTLDIFSEGRLVAHMPGLSQVPENDRYAPLLLGQPDYDRAMRQARPVEAAPLVVIEDLWPSPSVAPQPIETGAEARMALTGGCDGLAVLEVGDFTGEAFSPADSDAEAAEKLRGIQTFELVGEVSILAVPDIVIQPDPDPLRLPEPLPPVNPCLTCPAPLEPRRPALSKAATAIELPPVFTDDQVFRVQSALIGHCDARGDRFAVLDPPASASRNDAAGISAIAAWRSRFDSKFAALYYPWLQVYEPRGTDILRAIPPSGHVLGQYAFHDRRTGVHRAPANARLAWVQDLSVDTDFGAQEYLNDLSVNVIRGEAGRGPRIMGARTLSSDPDARFVNIRRLILMIRRAVDVLSQWVVFEPNNAATRTSYGSVLQSFMRTLWVQGAFAGASAEQSFFVKCDEENNLAYDRDQGRLLAEIGIAPAYPLEFIVMRVGVQSNELQIVESASVARAA